MMKKQEALLMGNDGSVTVMDNDKEDRPLFTEEDRKRMEELPDGDRWAFYQRFSDISIRVRLADDEWASKRDQIQADTDQLVRDIKKRLACTEAKQQHPKRKDFEDAGVLPRQGEG